MINIDELLPIGSIVKAKSNAGNLVYVMITGISPDSNHEYDYAIVPYPAFSGSCVAMTMIKHEDIVKVVMKGADSPVWRRFLDSLRNSNELKAAQRAIQDDMDLFGDDNVTEDSDDMNGFEWGD